MDMDPYIRARRCGSKSVLYQTPRMTAAAPIPRHYGLDWLRIGAFAILILYHIGMVFVPWGFHVQLASLPWVAIPMLASNPWRLMLLRLLLRPTVAPRIVSMSGLCTRSVVFAVFACMCPQEKCRWTQSQGS